MITLFERFELRLTKAQARAAAHQGRCDAEVAELTYSKGIQRQLARIPDEALIAELREYGAWDAGELSDRLQNELRIVWIAACNIREEDNVLSRRVK